MKIFATLLMITAASPALPMATDFSPYGDLILHCSFENGQDYTFLLNPRETKAVVSDEFANDTDTGQIYLYYPEVALHFPIFTTSYFDGEKENKVTSGREESFRINLRDGTARIMTEQNLVSRGSCTGVDAIRYYYQLR